MTDPLHEVPLVPTLVPMLYMKDPAAAIRFYEKAFGAIVRWRIDGDNDTTHVAEISVPPARFRLHEGDSPADSAVTIGLLVEDPDKLVANAVAGGATVISAMRDFEYGYRQGTIKDPFGHTWCIERFDSLNKLPTMPD